MPLNPYFTKFTASTNGIILIQLNHNNPSAEAAMASELADYIMKVKLQSLLDFYNGWNQKRLFGTANTPTIQVALENIIGMCIGLSSNPKTEDHRQGWVAEHLWYFLVNGSYPIGDVVRVFDVGISPTEPGGDGFVIHQNTTGLYFRLWELKKISHTASTNVNQVISNATGQLNDKGTKYISKFVIENQNKGLSPAEEALLGQVINDWIDKKSTVGVGVSTISSRSQLQNPNFSPLVTTFPHISLAGNLEGRTIALENFDTFCDLVCRSLWNGI